VRPAFRPVVAILAVLASFAVASPAHADPYHAVDDTANTTQNNDVIIDVLANDQPNTGLTIIDVSNPPHGTTTDNGDGTVTFSPQHDFTGVVTFTYTAEDGDGDQDTATVTVGVDDTAPTANDDGPYTAHQDTTLNVNAAAGVLGNDTDTDNTDQVSAVPQTDATTAHDGTVTLASDGSFSYAPHTGFSGTDTFTYTVTDGLLDSDPATVTITVNAPPTAADDSYAVAQNGSLSVDAPGVLGNDSDPDGDTLTAVLDTDVTHGTLALASDGSFTYSPNADFHGADSFTYRADDSVDQSAAATVTIRVDASPTAGDDSYTAAVNGTRIVNAPGVLGNDSDPDGDTLTAVLDTDVTHGTLALASDGSFTYTPTTDFIGTDTFTYVADDGFAQSAAATVTIHVQHATVANDDSYAVARDTELVVSDPAQGVLANDSGDNPLSASVDSDPSNGTLDLNADGTFTYTPTAGFEGEDSFTYTASDGHLEPAPAKVTIDVGAAPVSLNDPGYSIGKNATLTVSGPLQGVLHNDSDPDGDTLSVADAPFTHPTAQGGTVNMKANGTFTYQPATGFTGADTFVYQATDGVLTGNTATVTIQVNERGPTAPDRTLLTFKGHPRTLDLLNGVSDPDGDPVHVQSTTKPTNHVGLVSVNGSGVATFTPKAGLCNGTGSFLYTVADPFGQHDSGSVAVTVQTAKRSTALAISGPSGPIRFGSSARITVHLFPAPAGTLVALVVAPVGKTARALDPVAVDSRGNASFMVPLGRTTLFRAKFAGDNCRLGSVSSWLRVPVRAGVTGVLRHAYGRSGPYFLFHDNPKSDAQRPLYIGTVAPPHPGATVTFRWQVLSGGVWKDYYVNPNVTLDGDSKIAVYITQGAVRGTSYRLRISWPGTAVNAPAAAPWRYFRITK
jgi:Bacterial Ig domain